MAGWTISNKGLYLLAKNDYNAVDLRLLILAGANIPAGLTDATSYDLNTITDVLGVAGTTEAAASGYARKDLASVALAEDDTDNRAEVTWVAPVWTTVAVGETWRAAVLYEEGGGTDGTRLYVGIDVFTTPLPTNGSDITLTGEALYVQRP